MKLKKWYWFGVFLVLVLPMLSIGDTLGLYFDSVYPDYAATQILNPQLHQVKWFIAWPFLCQMYHGTVNMWISMLSILLTGTTGVVQHHIVNSLLVLLDIYLIDKLLEKQNVSVFVRHAALLVLAFMPTIMTFALTQYYIELPGVAFLISAAIFFEYGWKIEDSGKSNCFFIIAFVFLGLSFYTYFNYLFFFPGFLILYIYKGADYTSKTNNFLIACYSMICGACLYFVGYFIIIINNRGLSKYDSWYSYLLIIGLILSISFGIFELIKNKKTKFALIISGILFGMFVICFLFNREIIMNAAASLDISGTSANISERIELIIQYVYRSFVGIDGETGIYGMHVTKYQQVMVILVVIITAIYILGQIIIGVQKKNINYIALRYLFILFIYLCCSTVLATRMQTQHFVPVFFLIVVITILEIDQLRYWMGSFRGVKQISYIILGLIASICLFLCATDRYRVLDHVFETGGTGYYTRAINILSEEAKTNLQKGEKEIYIFPEWGFMSGFNYITNNQVAFSVDFDSNNLKQYVDEGYELEIVYWDEGNSDLYLSEIDKAGFHIFEKKEYLESNGEIAFYKIEVIY